MKPTPLSILVAACLLLLAFPVLGGTGAQGGQDGPKGLQEQDRATLIARRDAKRKAPFLKTATWYTDYDAARDAAREGDRLILAYFTRSFSPSPPCEALEKEIFTTESFVESTKDVVLYCHITSRVAGEPYAELPKDLGARAFPFVIALDEEGRPLAKIEARVDRGSILSLIGEEMAGYTALRAQAAAGDKAAKAKFLMRRIELGHLAAEEIQAELTTADYLSEEQAGTIRSGLASLKLMEIVLRTKDGDVENARKTVEAILAMKNAGSIPTGEMAFFFWQVILGHADQTADVALFTEALTKIKEMPGQNPDWMKRMETRQRALEFLKSRKKKDK